MLYRLIKDVVQGKPSTKRSSQWEKVRKTFLETHSKCAVCGTTINLEVHHKNPFHLHPEKELDPNNLVTLCESAKKCHWTFGHLYDWKSFNPNVDTDIILWKDKIENRPK